ncbi:Bin3 and/or Methyltransf 31 domain containing protein [Asbolus verrucosus]|uniref:RNA methyltransferase n=1 Tax=Asbolus verrucosus TaxID=1661398 RepID=A0A482VUG4_ASBVE|nr:Bin3 and/or Methyltransf 31 domain containing protein [Asbolus verrucosus]
MEESKLNFKAGNPGAVQFGNFINYYQFHPPENRLKLIPLDIWNENKPFFGLDLGCNTGDLTASIYNVLKEKVKYCKILGIDIDPSLVERAQEKIQYKEDVTFYCLDFMDEGGRTFIKDYLKKQKLNKFDVVFCFSITMWIHLNYGDTGLKKFLEEICSLGNVIVVEPQPWKCYRSAVKRMKLCKADFPLFKELKMRQTIEDDIEQFLLVNCKTIKMYESARTDWGRKLLIFKCS